MITVTGAESSPQVVFTAGVRGLHLLWVVALTESGTGTFTCQRGADPLLTLTYGATAQHLPEHFETNFVVLMSPGDTLSYEGPDVEVYGAVLGDVLA